LREKIRREGEKRIWREREKEENERHWWWWGARLLLVFLKKNTLLHYLQLQKISSSKMIRVCCSYLLFNFPSGISRGEIPQYFYHGNTSSTKLFHL